jgi:tetratricopeptide (TPR) repeat protein
MRFNPIFSAKTSLVFIAITLNGILLNAQGPNKKMSKADALYAAYNYPKAVKKYTQLNKEGISPYYTSTQIGHSYRLMSQPDKAEYWYKKAIQYTDVENATFFYLGQVLNQQQKTDEAIPYLNRYFQTKGYNFNQFTTNLTTLINYLTHDSLRYSIEPMPFNTEYSEMGPAINGRFIYYSTNKPIRSASQWTDVRNNKSFYRIFKHDTIMGMPDELGEDAFRTTYNNGPIFFTNDGNTVFITRNIYNKSEQTDLNIVVAVNRGGEWSKEVSKLPLKDDGYSIFHPALTPDNKRLYFASNKDGGYGGIDLYYSDLKGGFWTKPVNLGPNINTPGNEVFPFISNDGTLFFASDGHPGLGGLDIFSAGYVNESFTIPINMGAKLNSSSDDFSLVLKNDLRTGYFTSNRPGGKGDDDIYRIEIANLTALSTVSGRAINPDQSGIAGVQITILDASGNLFNQTESDTDGNFVVYLPNNSNFTLLFRKKLYQNQEVILQPSELRQKSKTISVEMLKR